MQSGATCGNGTIDTGETCDDSNTASGDGCSAACQTESVSTPHATLSVDKASVTSDLGVDEVITITATSADGFAGDVALTLAVTDGTTAITDWSTMLAANTLTVPAGGSATTTLKLSAMGDASALTGSIKVSGDHDATDATVAVTFNPLLRITFNDDGNGACAYSIAHNNPGAAWNLKVGRQISIVNGAATLGMTVHTDATVTGFPHETGKTAAGDAYTKTVTTAGETSTFYCHNPGNTDATIFKQGVAANYQYLTTVP